MLFEVRKGGPFRDSVWQDGRFLFSAEPNVARAAVLLFNAAVLPVYDCRVGPAEWKRAEFGIILPNGYLDARIGGRMISFDPQSYRIGCEFHPEKVAAIVARLTAGRQVVDG